SGARVQFNRNYKMETRIFVLETPPRGAAVALFTTLQGEQTAPSAVRAPAPFGSVRLEGAFVNLQGKLSAPGVSFSIPLDSAPTLECGAFVEVPGGRVRPGMTWDEAEAGRPPRAWRVLGTEAIAGATCVKLSGVQQTDDYENPRGDRLAWRREDTV